MAHFAQALSEILHAGVPGGARAERDPTAVRRGWRATPSARGGTSIARATSSDIESREVAMIAMRIAMIVGVIVGVTLSGACAIPYAVPVVTTVRPALDGSTFGRVLLAGFLAEENRDVDLSVETVRLLRSQIRRGSVLAVVEVKLPLVALGAARHAGDLEPDAETDHDPHAPAGGPDGRIDETQLLATPEVWRRIGEEYQQPLIITGTLAFTSSVRRELVADDQEAVDPFGRRAVKPVRRFQVRKIFSLKPVFLFIDGRTGTVIHRTAVAEEVSYDGDARVPPLAAYFELMDRVMPGVLAVFTEHQQLGPRLLLK